MCVLDERIGGIQLLSIGKTRRVGNQKATAKMRIQEPQGRRNIYFRYYV